jgi:hypothetical protein
MRLGASTVVTLFSVREFTTPISSTWRRNWRTKVPQDEGSAVADGGDAMVACGEI